MTQADKNFIETCKEIIEHGYSSEGTGVRTRWQDGEEANYISIVGVTNKYDVENIGYGLYKISDVKDFSKVYVYDLINLSKIELDV